MKNDLNVLAPELMAAINGCITIDNEKLPKQLQNQKKGCNTLAVINKKLNNGKKQRSQTEIDREIRQKNVELYASQVANNVDICYNGTVDEIQREKNTIAFLNILHRSRIENNEEEVF